MVILVGFVVSGSRSSMDKLKETAGPQNTQSVCICSGTLIANRFNFQLNSIFPLGLHPVKSLCVRLRAIEL